MKAGLGGGTPQEDGNRICKGSEHMQESQYGWGPETVAGMRQGLCHAGPRRFSKVWGLDSECSGKPLQVFFFF